eukprot:TRINITY_DN57155_c0_g1_i1.p1 TRINITY_DN57155_c0_g1~~TRINITY_DN57155_c0_g1_i1.p1  ORF type:complete len:518 (+),score=44.39 TRINITY_DN57155_c0_g1_i1:140-1693(+)
MGLLLVLNRAVGLSRCVVLFTSLIAFGRTWNPPELRGRTVWAIDPWLASRWLRPLWVLDTRRLNVVLLQPVDVITDLGGQERHGFQIYLCHELLEAAARDLSVEPEVLQAELSRGGRTVEGMRYLKYMEQLSRNLIGEGGLCNTRLFSDDHALCKTSIFGEAHDLFCVADAEMRTYGYRLVSEPPLARTRELYATNGLKAAHNKFRVGTSAVGDGCEFAPRGDRMIVPWALRVADAAMRHGLNAAKSATSRRLMKWSRKLLNVGAGDGAGFDPLWPLLSLNYTGTWVEREARHYDSLRRHLGPGVDRRIMMMSVDTSNIRDVLERSGLLREDGAGLDVLKVDIDSFDCDIVQAVLSEGVLPKLVVLEINWGFPPPLRYARHYSQHSRKGSGRKTGNLPFGCSISYSVNMMSEFGYDLLQVEANDAIFIHQELAKWLTNVSRREYQFDDNMKCHVSLPLDEFDVFRRRELFQLYMPLEWVREWFYHLSPPEALRQVHQNLSAWSVLFNSEHDAFSLSV